MLVLPFYLYFLVVFNKRYSLHTNFFAVFFPSFQNQSVGIHYHFFHISRIIILVDNTPFFKFTRSFDNPIVYVFMVKTTFITDKFIHFVVFVFSCCNSLYFVSEHPKGCFSATFIAISVSIKRLVKPNS